MQRGRVGQWAYPRPKVYVSDAALRNAVLLRGSEILVEVKYATDFGPMGPVQGGIQPFAVPAFAFLYLLGHAEHQGYLSRLA